MTLQQYRAKRDSRKTPEPKAKPGKPHRRPIFVVQRHDASRLHYDFRLEADGVLKSWAVPKEPTLDPSQKRLAIHVEDHPLAYASFKGTIPEGQYGAGTVAIWDKGTYENLLEQKPKPRTVPQGIEDGRLEIDLHGRKLRGRFALVRFAGRERKNNQWLLIKMKDEYAGAALPAEKEKTPTNNRRKALSPATKTKDNARAPRFTFSHTDKILFPDAGIRKREVLDFYIRIADHLLPHLRDRPVTLERLPEGLANGRAPHFWQKSTPKYYPDWIPRIELPAGGGKQVPYVLVNDAEVLLYLVNQGTLTFHVWFSRVGQLDRPDYVLFDLDPGKAGFQDALAVAKQLHVILENAGIPSFLKTSGKTGLHVLVSWDGDRGYDQARSWAEGIAVQVVKALPKKATVMRSKNQRGDRVYVDVMQNAKGRHAVPPYVLRAVPDARVSTPLRWNELTAELDQGQFNLRTIFKRLARQKEDLMEGLVS